jgi:hypothetical protein
MIFPNYALFTIAAYGICFGFMFKAKLFHNKSSFLDAMFKCAYCTGFWSGMFAWLMLYSESHNWSLFSPLIMLGYMFSSSASCYIIDTIVQKIEQYQPGVANLGIESEDEYEEVLEDELSEDELDEEDPIRSINPLERLRFEAEQRVNQDG